KRIGTNTRIIEFDLMQGTTREFLYPLDESTHGVSEILAINDHEFLVLERDGKPGVEAAAKQIYKIDLAGASDISGHETLPPKKIPADVVTVRKSPFLNLLDPKFGLAGADFPEKIEGLTFGPDLPDGRRLLIVAIDNDFVAAKPILLHAFAIDRADLPGLVKPEFWK
ncbi:MAG TPA: esterase-like activity of phytase family protein, partial [Planctomycetaceae bacterium]